MINRKVHYDYFDNLRGILIILVLIGHFGGDNTSTSPSGNLFLQSIEGFIYLFHMPLMFFVSGLFSKNTEKCRNNAFFDLFIPYLLFQVFYAIVRYIYSGTKEYLFNPFWPAPALWYLLALFVYRFILHDFIKIKGNLIVALLLSLCGISILGLTHEFAMNRIFANFIFFLLGYYIKPDTILKLKRRLFSKRLWSVLYCIGALFVSAGMFCAIFLVLRLRLVSFTDLLGLIGRSKNIVDINISLIYGPLFALAGILSAIILSIIIMSFTPEKKNWLTHVGKDTLPLYLSHMLVQLIYYVLQQRFFFFDNWTINYLLSFIPVAICVYVFSTTWYRKLFHGMLNGIKKIIRKE